MSTTDADRTKPPGAWQQLYDQLRALAPALLAAGQCPQIVEGHTSVKMRCCGQPVAEGARYCKRHRGAGRG